MKNKLLNGRWLLSLLLLILAAQTGFAYAEAEAVKKKEPLVITLSAQKVQQDATGKDVFSEAGKVKPGEVLEYRAEYANVSKEKLTGVMAILPVPEGMEYKDKTVKPAMAMATIDGIKYEVMPLKRKVKDKTGKEVVEIVPVAEYRGLRWEIGELAVGKKINVSARMQVSNSPAPKEELVKKPK